MESKKRIEVLGRGCRTCRAAELNLRVALDKLGIAATITRVTDPRIIRRRGVTETPTVFVDGHIFWRGLVPTVEEAKTWLGQKYLSHAGQR